MYLFDIDGTLLRGATGVHREAFSHVCSAVYGLNLSLDGIVTAGRTDSWIFAEVLRLHGVAEDVISAGMRTAFEVMVKYVQEKPCDLTHTVLPGVRDVLDGLRREGRVLGLLTGNLSGIAWTKLAQADIAKYFTGGGFGEESADRAHLVPIALAHVERIAGIRVRPQDTVVIGDTPLDIDAGRRAGTHTVAVATGPYDLDALKVSGADLVLPSFEGTAVLQELLAL
ncbi:MAG: HAD family hydrolase [Chloroflexota bacterium]|nr:MAG: haloacid dehalogenase [Chloroflexota bacterium]